MSDLIIFFIGGEGDFGALEFENSGVSLKEVYDKIPEGCASIQAEDMDYEGDWEVSIARQFHDISTETAKMIMDAVNTVAGEGGCGDYDSLKHRSYDFLLFEEDV